MDKPLAHCFHLGQMDASGSEEIVVYHHPTLCIEILGAYLTDIAAKTGHADNHGHYILYNRGVANAGTTALASLVTDTPTTDDLAANVPKAMTLATEESDRVLTPGQVITFQATESGTAGSGDLTDATLTILYRIGTGGWR